MVRILCAVLLAIMGCTALIASSVEQVSMSQVTKGSELIFRGRVLETRSFREGTSAIFTRVSFQVLEVFKGPKVGDSIELDFMGGKMGTLELRIADMQLPTIGETGIYFVESLTKRQVHPLYGWQQGHFLINKDASGTERVRTVQGKPVMSVSEDGPPSPTTSQITPRGLITTQSVQPGAGLTVADFKRRIQQIESSK
jgi:hypothetical protein